MTKVKFTLNIPEMKRRIAYCKINDKLAGVEPPKTDTTGQTCITTTNAKPGDPYLVIPATVWPDDEPITIYGQVRVGICN